VDRGKVFGIGWIRTGTTTLGEALRILGFKHDGQRFDLVDHYASGNLDPLIAEASRYDSQDDWPWLLMYRELDAAFPGSRFVLTTRDPDAWLRSYRNMLETRITSLEPDERRRVLWGLPFPDVSDTDLLERVAHHNRDVRDYFSDRPDDLLVVDWAKGDGWPELCSFLGMEEPALPFPHANPGWYRGPRWFRRSQRWVSGQLRHRRIIRGKYSKPRRWRR
jgi:hypothetical protein